jgi:nitrate/nitrite-specific signal transduction histidine kinase
MAGRARELGGTLTFRRARLGGLQVQVDIPIPAAPRRDDGNGATR